MASSWFFLLLTSESSPKHSPSKTLNAALQTQTQPKCSNSSLRRTLPTVQLPARYFVLPLPNPLPYFQSTFTSRTSGHCLGNFSAESFSVSPRPLQPFLLSVSRLIEVDICVFWISGFVDICVLCIPVFCGYLLFVDICVLWISAFCGYLRFVDICVLWISAFCGYLRFVDICVLWISALCGCLCFVDICVL